MKEFYAQFNFLVHFFFLSISYTENVDFVQETTLNPFPETEGSGKQDFWLLFSVLAATADF